MDNFVNLNLQVKIKLHFFAFYCTGLKQALWAGKPLKQVQGDRKLVQKSAKIEYLSAKKVPYISILKNSLNRAVCLIFY